ncbi:tetratricopeptide repeat protein [Candidatus Sumerlaeota bacterium]|nr:tetratricopeptide repeat protein [Candidatus Sumerlaeota bacterium]
MSLAPSLLLRGLAVFSLFSLCALVACQSEYKKHRFLGKQFEAEERYDEAIKEYEMAAAADPTRASPLYHIAKIRAKQKKFDEAIKHFRKAIEADPDYPDTYPDLAEALQQTQRTDEAIRVATEALNRPAVKSDVRTAQELEKMLRELQEKASGLSTRK